MQRTTPRSWLMNSHARPQPLLQIEHQVQHLRLHRDVERRDRLVGHHQRRVRHQRARDGDALALAAGKLVRIFCRRRGRQPDRAPASRQRAPAAQRRELRGSSAAIGSADDAADGVARVERAVRVLEYRLHMPPRGAQLRGRSARTGHVRSAARCPPAGVPAPARSARAWICRCPTRRRCRGCRRPARSRRHRAARAAGRRPRTDGGAASA